MIRLTLLSCLCTLILQPPVFCQNPGDIDTTKGSITVIITDLESDSGNVQVGLFASKTAFEENRTNLSSPFGDLHTFFPYLAQIDPSVYFIAMLSVALIALATVSCHSIRAALANPVEALGYE